MTRPRTRQRDKLAPDPGVRRAILAAASKSVREHGVQGLSIAAVLDRARLSTRAFYRHFESKDQLVAALFLELAVLCARRLEAVATQVGNAPVLEVDDLPTEMRHEVEGWVGAKRTARLIRENLIDVSELLPAELNTIRNKLDTFEARGWTEGDLSQRMKCRIYIAAFGAALPIFPPASIPFGIAFIQNCL